MALDETSKAKAQSVISAQAEALAHDDAAKAFSFASPEIQTLMGDQSHFLSMVQEGYAPVYRHRSFEFGEADGGAGLVVQQVHILDAHGIAWEATYTLMQQSDGTWRITSCLLRQVGQDA
eukprot:gene10667-10739_t